MKYAIKQILLSLLISVFFVGQGHGLFIAQAIRGMRVAGEEFDRKFNKLKDKYKEAFDTDFSVVTRSLIRDLENALLKFDLETAFDASAFPPEFAKGIPLTAEQIKVVRAKDSKYLKLLRQETLKTLFKYFFEIKELIKKKMGRAEGLEPYKLYPYVKPGSGNQQEGYKLMMSRVRAKVLGIPQTAAFPDTPKTNQARSDFEDELIVAHYQIVARILYYLQVIFDNLKQIALKISKEDYKGRYKERYDKLLDQYKAFKTKEEKENFYKFIEKILGIKKDDPAWKDSIETTTGYIRGIALIDQEWFLALSEVLLGDVFRAITLLPLSDKTLRKIASFLKISAKETDWQRAVKLKLDPLISIETQELKNEKKEIALWINFTEESLKTYVEKKFEQEKQKIEIDIKRLKLEKKSREAFKLFRTTQQKQERVQSIKDKIDGKELELKKYTDPNNINQTKENILRKKIDEISEYFVLGFRKDKYLEIIEKYPAPATEAIPDPISMLKMFVLNKRKIYNRFIYKQVASAYQLWNMIKWYLASKEKDQFLEQYIEATSGLIKRKHRKPTQIASLFDSWEAVIMQAPEWNEIENKILRANKGIQEKAGKVFLGQTAEMAREIGLKMTKGNFFEALKEIQNKLKDWDTKFEKLLELAKQSFNKALLPWEQELKKRAPEEYDKYMLRKLVTPTERKEKIKELKRQLASLTLTDDEEELKEELEKQIEKIEKKQEQLAQAIKKRDKTQIEVHEKELWALRKDFERKVKLREETQFSEQYETEKIAFAKLQKKVGKSIQTAEEHKNKLKNTKQEKFLKERLSEIEERLEQKIKIATKRLSQIDQARQKSKIKIAKQIATKYDEAKIAIRNDLKFFEEYKTQAKSLLIGFKKESLEKELKIKEAQKKIKDLKTNIEQLKKERTNIYKIFDKIKEAQIKFVTEETSDIGESMEDYRDELNRRKDSLDDEIKKLEILLKEAKNHLVNPHPKEAMEKVKKANEKLEEIRRDELRSFKEKMYEVERKVSLGNWKLNPTNFKLRRRMFDRTRDSINLFKPDIATPKTEKEKRLEQKVKLLEQRLLSLQNLPIQQTIPQFIPIQRELTTIRDDAAMVRLSQQISNLERLVQNQQKQSSQLVAVRLKDGESLVTNIALAESDEQKQERLQELETEVKKITEPLETKVEKLSNQIDAITNAQIHVSTTLTNLFTSDTNKNAIKEIVKDAINQTVEDFQTAQENATQEITAATTSIDNLTVEIRKLIDKETVAPHDLAAINEKIDNKIKEVTDLVSGMENCLINAIKAAKGPEIKMPLDLVPTLEVVKINLEKVKEAEGKNVDDLRTIKGEVNIALKNIANATKEFDKQIKDLDLERKIEELFSHHAKKLTSQIEKSFKTASGTIKAEVEQLFRTQKTLYENQKTETNRQINAFNEQIKSLSDQITAQRDITTELNTLKESLPNLIEKSVIAATLENQARVRRIEELSSQLEREQREREEALQQVNRTKSTLTDKEKEFKTTKKLLEEKAKQAEELTEKEKRKARDKEREVAELQQKVEELEKKLRNEEKDVEQMLEEVQEEVDEAEKKVEEIQLKTKQEIAIQVELVPTQEEREIESHLKVLSDNPEIAIPILKHYVKTLKEAAKQTKAESLNRLQDELSKKRQLLLSQETYSKIKQELNEIKLKVKEYNQEINEIVTNISAYEEKQENERKKIKKNLPLFIKTELIIENIIDLDEGTIKNQLQANFPTAKPTEILKQMKQLEKNTEQTMLSLKKDETRVRKQYNKSNENQSKEMTSVPYTLLLQKTIKQFSTPQDNLRRIKFTQEQNNRKKESIEKEISVLTQKYEKTTIKHRVRDVVAAIITKPQSTKMVVELFLKNTLIKYKITQNKFLQQFKNYENTSKKLQKNIKTLKTWKRKNLKKMKLYLEKEKKQKFRQTLLKKEKEWQDWSFKESRKRPATVATRRIIIKEKTELEDTLNGNLNQIKEAQTANPKLMNIIIDHVLEKTTDNVKKNQLKQLKAEDPDDSSTIEKELENILAHLTKIKTFFKTEDVSKIYLTINQAYKPIIEAVTEPPETTIQRNAQTRLTIKINSILQINQAKGFSRKIKKIDKPNLEMFMNAIKNPATKIAKITDVILMANQMQSFIDKYSTFIKYFNKKIKKLNQKHNKLSNNAISKINKRITEITENNQKNVTLILENQKPQKLELATPKLKKKRKKKK